MQSFNTKAYKKYSFEIDGKAYFLPGITLGLVDKIDAVISAGGGEAVGTAAIGLIRDLCPDDRTRKAVDTLEIHDVIVLFKDWTGGLSVGESESSADSQ